MVDPVADLTEEHLRLLDELNAAARTIRELRERVRELRAAVGAERQRAVRAETRLMEELRKEIG